MKRIEMALFGLCLIIIGWRNSYTLYISENQSYEIMENWVIRRHQAH